jgi:hypothetical protein
MTLTQHTALTAVAAAALAPFFDGESIALFAAGSILIDVDHYFLYIQRTRRFDIRGMFRYFAELQPIETTIPYVGLCIFHTFDFFLLVALLSWFQPFFLPLLAGFIFHFIIDILYLYRKKVLFIRAFFLLEHFIRRRKDGYPWY